MSLAITLLVGVALSSVVGTLLKQNESYQSYIVKFGPFWHEVYKSLGLYDVYSSVWFVSVVAFLLVSTSICIVSNTPRILRSMRHFEVLISEQSLSTMKQNEEWYCKTSANNAYRGLCYFFKKSGYRLRTHKSENGYTLATMNGASNRLGYLLTHMAIIVIFLGGALDSNLPLKIKTLMGQLRIEKDDNIPVSTISNASVLDVSNPSFRASVTIPEGKTTKVAFQNIADGYLVQQLPFAIEVADFRIEHYASGQPKSFESDLIIHDPQIDAPITKTISVNHPWSYKTYTIYQSSFTDGGSKLNILLHQLRDNEVAPTEITGHINETLSINTDNDPIRLELEEFRLFNIFPVAKNEDSGKKFRDHGPNFTFKLRQRDGSAVEFVNYMYPTTVDGDKYFLSGTRSSPEDEFKYLYIPADHTDSLGKFLKFQALLRNRENVMQAAKTISKQYALSKSNKDFVDATTILVKLFLSGGLEGIQTYLQTNVPEEEQAKTSEVYMNILQSTLHQVFADMLKTEGHQMGDDWGQFFRDAVHTLSILPFYPSPFYLELKNFEHKQATGLQITRTPGKIYVYSGFAMLVIGIFLLFYVSHQQIWVIIEGHGNNVRLLIAGNTNRHKARFSAKFKAITSIIRGELKPIDD